MSAPRALTAVCRLLSLAGCHADHVRRAVTASLA
jgi:hypothetical protein